MKYDSQSTINLRKSPTGTTLQVVLSRLGPKVQIQFHWLPRNGVSWGRKLPLLNISPLLSTEEWATITEAINSILKEER